MRKPFYVILNQKEEVIINPRAYDLSVEGFNAFLDEAVRRYKTEESKKNYILGSNQVNNLQSVY